MPDVLAQVDALDNALGNSAALSADQAKERRAELACLRTNLATDLSTPAPGTTTQVGGATITHRPDIAAQQASVQGEPGYLPAKKEPLAKGDILPGAGGTIQALARAHAAEAAKIGIETR